MMNECCTGRRTIDVPFTMHDARARGSSGNVDVTGRGTSGLSHGARYRSRSARSLMLSSFPDTKKFNSASASSRYHLRNHRILRDGYGCRCAEGECDEDEDEMKKSRSVRESQRKIQAQGLNKKADLMSFEELLEYLFSS